MAFELNYAEVPMSTDSINLKLCFWIVIEKYEFELNLKFLLL